MNKYRVLRREYDYECMSHNYQCLACKEYLSAVGNYCMHCGVRFEGCHVSRPIECPRWAWDRWGADNWGYEYAEWELFLNRPSVVEVTVEYRYPQCGDKWFEQAKLASDAGIVTQHGSLSRVFWDERVCGRLHRDDAHDADVRFVMYRIPEPKMYRRERGEVLRTTPVRRAIAAAESVS